MFQVQDHDTGRSKQRRGRHGTVVDLGSDGEVAGQHRDLVMRAARTSRLLRRPPMMRMCSRRGCQAV